MWTVLDADDDRLNWSGVWSLERGDGWVAPWRIPYHDSELYFPTGGSGVASMPSGVRISLRTDSARLVCRYGTTPPLSDTDPPEFPRLDVRVDGVLHGTVMLERAGAGVEFTVDDLPPGPRLVELWLPLYYQFRLYQLRLDAGATVLPDDRRRPVWVHYGCSISQGRGAASPSRTFLAQAAAARSLDLRSLSVAGACLLQPMFARLVRDTPAELVTIHTGTNIYYYGSLNRETLQGAVFGFIKTIRDAQPATPIILMSPTYGPRYETQPGPTRLTHRLVRRELAAAVGRLRERGDEHLHYVDGLTLFGSQDAGLLLERPEAPQIHFSAPAHDLVGRRLVQLIDALAPVAAPVPTPRPTPRVRRRRASRRGPAGAR